MFDLKCKRQDCTYNKNCNCTATDVNVSNLTECKTYKPGENKKEKDKIPQPPARKNINVDCKAKCLFNKECLCIANGISVLTHHDCPECATFMPK